MSYLECRGCFAKIYWSNIATCIGCGAQLVLKETEISMSKPKSVLSSDIAKAVAEGKKLQKKLLDDAEAQRIKHLKQVQENNEYLEKAAMQWAMEQLPELIKTAVASGKSDLYLGSHDYGSPWLSECLFREAECKRRGMKTEHRDYKADGGSDGAYAHGDGYCIYATWTD